MNDTQSKIGKFLDEGETRDAVHIAVAPVVATEQLSPGDRIGFVEAGNTEKVGKRNDGPGIVDPFLLGDVYPGARFWMFLLPNTITGMRHTWVHPAFEALPDNKNESRAWIEAFAAEMDQTYGRLMDAADKWVDGAEWAEKRGERWHDSYTYDNTEAYKNVDYAKWPIFWKHYEIVRGKKVKDHEATFFTCSC